jgi:DNA-binding XRE family transcriptional regulator
MTKDELRLIRQRLGKTQHDMADMLGVSIRAIQSFEQGWRKIPAHVQRQALFLVSQDSNASENEKKLCWEVKQCSKEWRERCMAHSLNHCDLCWFVNGKVCQGVSQKNWQKKMNICRKCEVFRSTFLFLEDSKL